MRLAVSLLFYRISIKMEMDSSNSFPRIADDLCDFETFSQHLLSMWSVDCNWAFYKAWTPPNITRDCSDSGSDNRNHMNRGETSGDLVRRWGLLLTCPGYCLVTAHSFWEALESDGSLGGSGAVFRSLESWFINQNPGPKNGYLCKTWAIDCSII